MAITVVLVLHTRRRCGQFYTFLSEKSNLDKFHPLTVELHFSFSISQATIIVLSPIKSTRLLSINKIDSNYTISVKSNNFLPFADVVSHFLWIKKQPLLFLFLKETLIYSSYSYPVTCQWNNLLGKRCFLVAKEKRSPCDCFSTSTTCKTAKVIWHQRFMIEVNLQHSCGRWWFGLATVAY